MRFLLLLLLVSVSARAEPGDPLALQLFSQVDREVVELGGEIVLAVEALAVPQTMDAARALIDAFGACDLARQLGPGLEVVESDMARPRATDGVLVLRRTLRIRVQDPALRELPALRLAVAVGGREWLFVTRPRALTVYRAQAAVDRAARSVVSITVEGTLGGQRFERIGSAFAVGGDALVTAYHVVVGAHRVRVQMPNGREVRIDRAWTLDPERDVAVLALDPRDVARLAPLVIAPPSASRAGAAPSGAVSFTAGWPDRVQRSTVGPRFDDLVLDGRRVRMSANAVSPGDSGGPLLDGRGRVLGVVVSGRGDPTSPDVLGETLCLAADLAPALRQYRAAPSPVPLADALDAAELSPAGQAHAAAGTMGLASTLPALDRAAEVGRLQDAVRRGADDATLLFLAGSALEDAGDPSATGALAAARRRGYVPAAYALGHHLMERGHHGLAAEVFDEMRGTPYRRLAAFGQAQALVALGRYADAREPLAIVLDHDSEFAPALFLLGMAHLAQGRDAQARALVVRLADRPDWAQALRLPVEAEALRPPVLEVLPRVAMR